MYYSGHGHVNYIKLIDFDLTYTSVVEHILYSANKQINKIAKVDKRYTPNPNANHPNYYELGWFVNWYVDACHSGSCKDETQMWIKNEMGGDVRDYKDYSSCSLKYFDRDSRLELRIYTSSRSNECS